MVDEKPGSITRSVAAKRGVRVGKWLGDGAMLIGVEAAPVIALGGGGALAYAHIALIQEIHARGIPIDMVAGVSGGSVIGAFYYLRIVYYMYFGAEDGGLETPMAPLQWGLMVASAAIMVLGIANLFGVEGAALAAAETLVQIADVDQRSRVVHGSFTSSPSASAAGASTTASANGNPASAPLRHPVYGV